MVTEASKDLPQNADTATPPNEVLETRSPNLIGVVF